MRIIKTLLLIVVICVVFVAYLNYAGYIADPIVGEWKPANGGGTIIFNNDGTGTYYLSTFGIYQEVPMRWTKEGFFSNKYTISAINVVDYTLSPDGQWLMNCKTGFGDYVKVS